MGEGREEPTLNADMDMVLDLFDITGVVVGFGEGVCGKRASVSEMEHIRWTHATVASRIIV